MIHIQIMDGDHGWPENDTANGKKTEYGEQLTKVLVLITISWRL